jgi:hypothetical protein
MPRDDFTGTTECGIIYFMSEVFNLTLHEQLRSLEPDIPHYDYQGLSLPKAIIVDGVFGAHRDVALIEGARELLGSYDIVVHESLGASEPTNKLLQRVARGDYKARERMLAEIALSGHGPSDEEDQTLSIKSLYNIRKPLVVIDPPAGHPITRKTESKFSREATHSIDFDKAVRNEKEKLTAESQTNLDRENYMLRSFCEQITYMANNSRRLSKAEETGDPLRAVLFNFGLTHAGLFEGLKEVAKRSGFELEGAIHLVMGDDLALHTAAQAYTRHIYGYAIDDNIAARAVVESVLVGSRIGENPSLSQMVTTSEVVSEIDGKTMDELRSIFNSIVLASKS